MREWAMTATLEPDVAPRDAADTPRRPRLSRFSSGHLLIALAAMTAVVANYAVLRAQDDTVRIAVVAAETAPGEVLSTRGVTFVDVRAGDALLDSLVTVEDLARLDGHVAATRLRPGEPLRRSDLQPPAAPDQQRAMSVPIAPEQAVGGRLAVGDRVDVIEVRDGDAAYLVTAAEVLDVPDSELRAGLGGMRAFSVTLAVDERTALRLALAQRHGELHLVRSTGAAPAAAGALGGSLGATDANAGAAGTGDAWGRKP